MSSCELGSHQPTARIQLAVDIENNMATLVDDWVENAARASQTLGALPGVATQNGAPLAAAESGVPPIFSLEGFDQQITRCPFGTS